MEYIKYTIAIFLIAFLAGCTKYEYNEDYIDNCILIEKIGIDEKYSISSIKTDVNGIVMFDEYGRPDEKNSNVIIGAHSGYGSNAYFNYLSNLELGDEIIIYYENKEYKYSVTELKEVLDTDLYILNETGERILTLLTCKMGDSSKRIVVLAK